MKKKLYFVGKNVHLIVGTTQYCDTQQTKHKHNKHYTTQNSCYIISFETFFGRFWKVVCLSWIGLGTGGS